MDKPQLNRAGRALPAGWQDAIRRWASGVDLLALVADLFLQYPGDGSGLDPVVTRRWFYVVEQLAGRYFRVTTMGAEHIPSARGIILACHSGVVPWDATLLVSEITRLTGRFSRNSGHDFWGRYPWLRNLLVPTGMVLGRRAAFEELLERDELVTIFADGGQGNRRAYYLDGDRYTVKPDKGFAPGGGGYVKLAIRTRSPIVPVAIVGTEEIHYCLGDVPQLAQYFGVPFWPLIASPLPLPARVYIRFGAPIRLALPPSAADDQGLVDRVNEKIRNAFQVLVDDTLARRHGIYWSRYDGSVSVRSPTPASQGAPVSAHRVAA
jgi:acyltransferase-like protein